MTLTKLNGTRRPQNTAPPVTCFSPPRGMLCVFFTSGACIPSPNVNPIVQDLLFPRHTLPLLPADAQTEIGMNRRTLRAVVYSMVESGVARLVIDNDFNHFQGCLLSDREESISISGHSSNLSTREDERMDDSRAPIINRTMRISVVDGETGDKFMVENVTVKLVPKVQDATNTTHYWIEINCPSIKFTTQEILIGNRADIEIQRYLNPGGGGTLLRCNSHSASRATEKRHVSGEHKCLHVGPMTLRLVAAEKVRPSERTFSTSDTAEVIEKASSDFLV